MLLTLPIVLPAAVTPAWDTSKWVGAEYTPWRASNEMWWADYEAYRPDLLRELPAIKEILGFTALRVWLHTMLHARDAPDIGPAIEAAGGHQHVALGADGLQAQRRLVE